MLTAVPRGRSAGCRRAAQHQFNAPYQLGKYDGRDVSSPLRHAHEHAMQLQPNDAIVLASDGIFDNLFPEDFPKLLEPYLARARQYGHLRVILGWVRTAARRTAHAHALPRSAAGSAGRRPWATLSARTRR